MPETTLPPGMDVLKPIHSCPLGATDPWLPAAPWLFAATEGVGNGRELERLL